MSQETPVEGVVIPAKSTKYEEWMCEKIIEIGAEGGHVEEMCLSIGIASKDTFYRWRREYPEFNEAAEEAKMRSIVWWQGLMKDMASGKIKGDAKAAIMVLNNKHSDTFNRSGSSTTEINIGNINSLGNLSTKDLIEKTKKLMSKLDYVEAVDLQKFPEAYAENALNKELDKDTDE